MRTRLLYYTSLGMEVHMVDLSSDSEPEGEVSAHSLDHKRPSRQLGPDPNHGRGDTGSSAMDMLFEQAGAPWPPSDALKKGKEKVAEGESVGPPEHSGELLAAAVRVLGAGTGSYPWSVLVSKCKAGDGGDDGAGSWGSWGDRGDQLNSAPMPSEWKGFYGTYALRGMPQLHSDSAAASIDKWKGILGVSPADPVNPQWCYWDTDMKDNEDETFSERSVAARENSGCDYFPMDMEDSTSWLSKVKGLNFPLPDEYQLRTRQIENDEAFARRLQEQLNQEQPGSQPSQASQRDRSMAHLYSYGWHSPVPTPSRGGLQRNSNCPQAEQRNMLISQLTKGCFTEGMDLETKMVVLESLTEAFRNCEDPSPDSDDDDYEDRIALDVDFHHRGASDEQINSLPLSPVKGENCSDKPCNICLDCPVAGDSLRRLPCSHKFHKKCIDKWLGMKTWCPVCKLNAFSQ